MDKEYYTYTLNFLQELSADLVAAAEAYKYLHAIEDTHPDKTALTKDMIEAFDNLATNCEDFLNTHNR